MFLCVLCLLQAKQIFSVVCPDEVFLPKPPHPDDIIYVDTEEVAAAGKGKGDWGAEGGASDTAVDVDANKDKSEGRVKESETEKSEKSEKEKVEESEKEKVEAKVEDVEKEN
jgi:hypothetical protein